jgi:hypothetical protein
VSGVIVRLVETLTIGVIRHDFLEFWNANAITPFFELTTYPLPTHIQTININASSTPTFNDLSLLRKIVSFRYVETGPNTALKLIFSPVAVSMRRQHEKRYCPNRPMDGRLDVQVPVQRTQQHSDEREEDFVVCEPVQQNQSNPAPPLSSHSSDEDGAVDKLSDVSGNHSFVSQSYHPGPRRSE